MPLILFQRQRSHVDKNVAELMLVQYESALSIHKLRGLGDQSTSREPSVKPHLHQTYPLDAVINSNNKPQNPRVCTKGLRYDNNVPATGRKTMQNTLLQLHQHIT